MTTSHQQDWETVSRKLQSRIESWMKSVNVSRDEAEKARSKAEADRNAAQEARDQALRQMVQETGLRLAAQERMEEVDRQRDEARSENMAMKKEYSKMEKEIESLKLMLAGEREALQISEAERKATRRDLDAVTKELVQLRRDNERLSNSLTTTSRQLDDTKAALSASKEDLKVQASKAQEFERRANSMIEEAKRSVTQLRSSSLLQEGLRAKAEIGMTEAAREMSAAQDAAAAVAVERKLLQDRMMSLVQERDSLARDVDNLTKQLEESKILESSSIDSAEMKALQIQMEDMKATIAKMEGDLHKSTMEVEHLQQEVDQCRESEEMMRRAMEEATHAKQEMRAAWHASEDALYEMSQARSAAESAKRQMTEALVRERSSRIMAQQELERVVGEYEERNTPSSDSIAAVDKARLALWHEEMAAEHKSLELILNAVKEMQQSTGEELPQKAIHLHDMSVFMDIAAGDREQAKEQERDYSLSKEYLKIIYQQFGWPDDLSKLSDESKEMFNEMFLADSRFSKLGNPRLDPPDALRSCRFRIELFSKQVPKACENFKTLCIGGKKGKTSGKPLHYLHCIFHRLKPDFCLQGGDIVRGDGTGGDSIYNGCFKDEKGGLKIKHDDIGVVSMANSGSNTNKSQFFFTLGPASSCDGKHVVIGKVINEEAIQFLRDLNERAKEQTDETPLEDIFVQDCGNSKI
eukprot:jgi/Picsp_1/2431/NSC_05892-R1_peptidyl-prolyl cis-trans cyclophilin-type